MRYAQFFMEWTALVLLAAALGSVALSTLDSRLAQDALQRQESFAGFRLASGEAR